MGKRHYITAGVFAFFFALAMSFQYRVHFTGDIDQPLYPDTFLPLSAGSALIFAAVFAASFFCLLLAVKLLPVMNKHHIVLVSPGPEITRKRSVVSFLLCALPFAICSGFFLALDYPGFVLDDSISSLEQAMGDMWFSNHHPVLFTLFVTLFVKIGRAVSTDFNTCVFLFSLSQMLIIASALGYILSRLFLRGVRLVWILFAYVYYLVNAPFTVLSIAMWKDPLFSVFFFLLMWRLYEAAESKFALLKDRRFNIRLMLAAFLTCFFRNNGIYIVFMLFAGMFVHHAKEYRRFAIGILTTAAIVLLIRYPGFAFFHINTAHAEESVGIPMQELAYVITEEEELTETEILYEILPADRWKRDYHPFRVDSIKWDKAFDTGLMNSEEKTFLHSWLINLPKHIPSYLHAHLLATYGFWSVQTNNPYEYTELFIVDNVFGIHRTNVLARAGLPDLSFLNGRTGNLCAGTLIWILFFVLALIIACGLETYLPVLMPGVFLWMTLMIATPVAFSFRYVMGIAYAMPLLILLPFLAARNENTAPEKETT